VSRDVFQGEPVGVTCRGVRQGHIRQLSAGVRALLSSDAFSLSQPDQQTQTNQSHRQLGIVPTTSTTPVDVGVGR